MSKLAAKSLPPDQAQREQALDPTNSVLVQAPAGSGKTDLLTRRFLCLLAEVEEPGQIVAITFTKAAAAEMRHRILSKLEEAATQFTDAPDAAKSNAMQTAEKLNPADASRGSVSGRNISRSKSAQMEMWPIVPEEYISEDEDGLPLDAHSIEALARRALNHSQALGWNLLDQPAQLRISTIDAFCRDLALQQPMLSGLGDGLDIYEQPDELYSRAARRTLEEIDTAEPTLRSAIERLLLWRDNHWQEMEKLLVEMLRNRDRWMHDFVLGREQDWEALRRRLERPFAKAICTALSQLSRLLDRVPDARDEALALARFACSQGASAQFQELAEIAEIPSGQFNIDDFASSEALEEARRAHDLLASLLLTGANFRKTITKRRGFPADHKAEKAQFFYLISRLSAIPGLESALAQVRNLPPARYSEDDWQIVRACFALLRRAVGQLHVVFAEAGAVDYIEVAQIAQGVLRDEDGQPSEAAISVADKIRHILVDEFQDTSRRQHELLRRLIAAWPEREGRSCFVVGDPMQSIYFFRDADAELFPRVKVFGLEIPGAEPLLFDPVALTSNFRTTEPLVDRLNNVFRKVFAADDGSGVTFTSAEPARDDDPGSQVPFNFHLNFAPQMLRGQATLSGESGVGAPSLTAQTEEIIALIRSHMDRIDRARAQHKPYRIAVLGRARKALAPIAKALRDAAIPFRAIDLEKLATRPEVLDALALARALLNPLDRVSWLGVLRAPWCGLSLLDLHTLTSADDPTMQSRAVPGLLTERLNLLSPDGRLAAERVIDAIAALPALRFAQPTASLGTWLEQVWLQLGGAQCVDRTARANLDLLWQSLDSLPNGEQDLLGPALNAALEKLAAQPDPAASSECGVHLMTIHKSKGLEFEVVIVPELQAAGGKGRPRLLSWLERGITAQDDAEETADTEEITEFLVAPLQSKGAERSSAKAWVDRMYRDREKQEMRRLLYVAATRARDELHLFARPACKQEKDGSWTLREPSDSLLATAWPALEPEIRQRFDQWKSTAVLPQTEPTVIESIAAEGESNLLVMPSQIKPPSIRRLPADYRTPEAATQNFFPQPITGAQDPASETWDYQLYQRHEGGLLSRALGIAVHSLLEELAHLRQTQEWESARAALQHLQPRIAAQVRASGIDRQQSSRIAAQALEIALDASRDSVAQWILSPHADAANEVRWAGVIDNNLRTVQVDRIFRSGANPQGEGADVWWIIDYKTAHADKLAPTVLLPQLRAIFAPQIETYAKVLRNLHGSDAQIRAGLYYPRMTSLDWWTA
jgi:ATP-dependent exoDNAse (exonuclease V) beta subunit